MRKQILPPSKEATVGQANPGLPPTPAYRRLCPQPSSWFRWEVLTPCSHEAGPGPFVFRCLSGLWARARRLWCACRGAERCHPVSLGVGRTSFHAFWIWGLRVTPKQVPLVGQEASSLWVRLCERPPHSSSEAGSVLTVGVRQPPCPDSREAGEPPGLGGSLPSLCRRHCSLPPKGTKAALPQVFCPHHLAANPHR